MDSASVRGTDEVVGISAEVQEVLSGVLYASGKRKESLALWKREYSYHASLGRTGGCYISREVACNFKNNSLMTTNLVDLHFLMRVKHGQSTIIMRV